jgi:hypothetical protein
MKSLTRRVNLRSQQDTIIGNENAISLEDNLINILINATLNYLANLVLDDQKSKLFRI